MAPGRVAAAAAASGVLSSAPNAAGVAAAPRILTPDNSNQPSHYPTVIADHASPLVNVVASMSSRDVFLNAAKQALAGGLPGGAATVFQITCFMWLQTTVSNQYRSGKGTWSMLRTLWRQGGIRRLYNGYSATVVHGMLARFGDTAANSGVLALLESHERAREFNVPTKTFCASLMAASWRMALTPIEHVRMNFQTRGKEKGFKNIHRRVSNLGARSLFHGSMALGMATLAQHFPWFCTFNYLNSVVPVSEDSSLSYKVARHGSMGLASSFVSDITSNCFKIMATIRITSKKKVSYYEAAKRIIETDGLVGVFGRGLKTRMLSNGCQAVVFAIVWKQLEARFFGEYVRGGLGDPYKTERLRKEREESWKRESKQ